MIPVLILEIIPIPNAKPQTLKRVFKRCKNTGLLELQRPEFRGIQLFRPVGGAKKSQKAPVSSGKGRVLGA
jgi:hypothetical protein